jgi:selenide,water dikinase
MSPGHVAGFYSRGAYHINLWSLADFVGAQFLIDPAIELDLTTRLVIPDQLPDVKPRRLKAKGKG